MYVKRSADQLNQLMLVVGQGPSGGVAEWLRRSVSNLVRPTRARGFKSRRRNH